MSRHQPLTPSLLLNAYAHGIFPMSTSRRGGQILWFAPDPRAVIEFSEWRPGRHLRRLMRNHPFELRVNGDFRATMEGCAGPRSRESDTWISPELIDAYCQLHAAGFAHSVEAWRDGQMVGGLYMVQVGAALMGESMFSRETNASKVCLIYLMQRMSERGFTLLDTQFITGHLTRFGAVEISRTDYQRRLAEALAADPPPSFVGEPMVVPPPKP
ncbi:MAG: leucyl/phenylalanyl-tRNA--protein transferase [Planctomycetota bacterium]